MAESIPMMITKKGRDIILTELSYDMPKKITNEETPREHSKRYSDHTSFTNALSSVHEYLENIRKSVERVEDIHTSVEKINVNLKNLHKINTNINNCRTTLNENMLKLQWLSTFIIILCTILIFLNIAVLIQGFGTFGAHA